MLGFLVRWALAAVALWLTAQAVNWLFGAEVLVVAGFWALLAVAVLAVVNALVVPFLFLFKIVTFPITLLTLGLWSLLVGFCANAAVLYFVGYPGWVIGFRVKSVAAALAGAALLSLLNAVLGALHRAVLSPRRY